jgi:hypothetical protein
VASVLIREDGEREKEGAQDEEEKCANFGDGKCSIKLYEV